MTGQPSMWGRLLAVITGEVSADTLAAYRRAGLAVYELLRQTEDRRLELKAEGVHPWAVDDATQAMFVCAWNAFALQALGDEFLAADERTNPATVGYVPPVTAEQMLAFYSQVEGWLSRANKAQSNPAYRVDLSLPADLPPWSEVVPCPTAHLEAMLAAMGSLRSHAEGAMAVFPEEGAPAEWQVAMRRLGELQAEGGAKAKYAEQLWGPRAPQELHEQIERHAKDALELYYRLGQLLAMPGLVQAESQRAQLQPPTVRPVPGLAAPGQPGFDPWCLTDPESRLAWKRDPEAPEAIDFLWKNDPAPERTLAIQAEIDAALARGDIARTTDSQGALLGNFYCCPWAPVYVVARPVTIGGRRLRTLQQFTFDVSAEEIPEGGPFRREILVGSFQPTTSVDYCVPGTRGHHD